MTKIRTVTTSNGVYANVEDIRAAMNDEDMILRSAVMLQVAMSKGDAGVVALRMAIAYFFTEGTGILAAKDN